MTRLSKWVLLLPVVAGIGGVSSGTTAANAGPGLSCDIEVSHSGGGVTLKGVVTSGVAADGTYTLKVTSAGSGSSNINQSGDFSVGAGRAAQLATVSLGGNGSYQARLSVTVDGHTTSCAERIGGSL
jgi:hypothetical protein